MTKIYHNPRCTKSRETLKLLIEKGETPEIVEYLTNTPSSSELKGLIDLLGISAADLVRKGEEIYKTQYKGKHFTEAEWIDILIKNPKLIERPIVVKNGKAIIGRPPENILQIL